MTSANVAVFGLGYVGSVTAACLACLGHNVIGVDRDEHKIALLRSGKAPFFEPQLESIIASTTRAGRLRTTLCVREAIKHADIALVCVGTPSDADGNMSFDQIHRVIGEMAEAAGSKRLILAIRSTVFPGTLENFVLPSLTDSNIVVVSNPEFLREGSAVKDFMEPPLIVVGGNDYEAMRRVAKLYCRFEVEPCLVSFRTAEMIKYACNAFHAVKISFANEIGSLCRALVVPAHEVMDTFYKDDKLNISSVYLKPGFAFGGSCLPKDLRAIEYRARSLDLELPLLFNTLQSNQQHLERAVQRVLELKAERIGIVGLSFKENTDDLRESPVVSMIEKLLARGCAIKVWDPNIRMNSIYGANLKFIRRSIPQIDQLLAPSLEVLMDWASHIVTTQSQNETAANFFAAASCSVLNLAEL